MIITTSAYRRAVLFWQLLVIPKNINSDRGQRTLFLNILLLLSIFVFTLLNIIRLIDTINNKQDRGLPIIYTLIILLFFIFLRWLSYRSLTRLASWLFISAYSLLTAYSFINWGADLPAALLLGVLIITFLGVLISAPAALWGALILNTFLICLTNLHNTNIIKVASYWRTEKHEIGDAITYAILLMLITSLVLIFERKIRQSLKRAEKSEKDLMAEKDALEERVIERTKKINEMEAEKINQLYRLAEFGRVSSGIFHDLINPLTAVSLNLEQINNSEDKIISAKDSLSQAITASREMEDLIACIKRCIRKENCQEKFSLNEEIETVIKILSYKAKQANIQVIFKTSIKLDYFGDSAKFGQVMANLISNGIEANTNFDGGKNKTINIQIIKYSDILKISVQDWGSGISTENIKNIFKPFFSTKPGYGLGIGLSSAKNIIEKDFLGKLEVQSQVNQGTTFTISLPLNKNI